MVCQHGCPVAPAELAEAVAELGALPMPTASVPAEVLADVVAGVIRDYDRDVWDATGNQIMALRASLAEYRDRTSAPVVSPWQRAVDGLNALVDANIAFHVEPDGHISNPFGDEHIEWDHDTARWRLVHDDDDEVLAPHPAPCRHPASPDCVCPLSVEQLLTIERDRPATATTHDCTIPLSRRLACGHCPHEVCQDCDRCPHTCRCASAEDPHDSPLHHTYAEGRDLPEYLYCGADLGSTTFPYTCHRQIGHAGDCKPLPDLPEVSS